jgi:predicted transcriptional regulator
MLNKLLDLINQGGSLTPNSLARQLDTTPTMVEMMIEELTRRGMLKVSEFEKNCDSESCGYCYLSKTCHSNTQRVWTSTSKK